MGESSDALSVAAYERNELVSLLFDRCYMHALFHKVLGGAPNASVLEAYTSEATAHIVGEFGQEVPALRVFSKLLKTLRGEEAGELAEKAAAEYTRLFVGPARPEVFPWETPYVEEMPIMHGQTTLEIRGIYAQEGYTRRVRTEITEDHIATMLGFLWQMAERARTAFLSGDFTESLRLLTVQAGFLDGHVLGWVDQLALMARSATSAVMYPQLLEAPRGIHKDRSCARRERQRMDRRADRMRSSNRKRGRQRRRGPERTG